MGLLFPKIIMRKSRLQLAEVPLVIRKSFLVLLYISMRNVLALPIIVPKMVTIMVAHAATRKDRKIGDKIVSKLMAIMIGR